MPRQKVKPVKKPVSRRVSEPIRPQSNNKKNFHIEFKNPEQKEAWQAFEEYDVLFLLGPAGVGKTFLACAFAINEILAKNKKKIVLTRPVVEAGGDRLGYLPGCQPLTQKIVTSNGWTTMGQIKVGDKVIGRDGLPTEVIGIYPKGEKDTYKIKTTDGRSTVCCLDHLWYTQTKEEKSKKQQGKVRPTKDIIFDLEKGIKHFLPINETVYFDNKDLPISPYTLGVLLGDGCSESTHIRFTSADDEIVERVNSEIKCLGLYCKKAKNQYSKAFSYTLSSIDEYWEGSRSVKITEIETGKELYFSTNSKALEFIGCKKSTLSTRVFYGATVDGKKYEKYGEPWTNPVLKFFRESGLHGKKAWDKFIPHDYKYSSVKDRIDILRGLLDTDGHCRKRLGDQVNFYTTSPKLAEDVVEIVRSLGGKARLKSRDRRNDCNRKSKAIPRRILYEVSIYMSKEINPFFLSRKSNRFVGKNVSHIEITSIEKVGHEKVQCILVDNKEHLYLTDDFIVTHNTLEEKINPYMLPMFDCMEKMLGTEGPQREMVDKSIKTCPIAYMRGATYENSICIFDEAQNATASQLKLFLTRFGENSKIIITGDPLQSDLRKSDRGLMHVVNRLDGVPGIGILHFDAKSIVRHPLIAAILERLEEKEEVV